MIVTTVKPTFEEVSEIILNQFTEAIESNELAIYTKLAGTELIQKISNDFFGIIIGMLNEHVPYSEQTVLVAGEICLAIEQKIAPEPIHTLEELNNMMENNTLFN
jgi:hypothetical protein